MRRIRGVEVLGLSVAHDPAAKGDHAAAGVEDGEHHPVAEGIEDAAAALQDEICVRELLIGKAHVR